MNLNFELDCCIGDKVGHANFCGRSAICTRLRMEKQCENGTKQVKTGKNSTSGYAAKLNFEFDSGMGDKVGHASFRGRSTICTCLRMEKQWENGTEQVKTALRVTGESEFRTRLLYWR